MGIMEGDIIVVRYVIDFTFCLALATTIALAVVGDFVTIFLIMPGLVGTALYTRWYNGDRNHWGLFGYKKRL